MRAYFTASVVGKKYHVAKYRAIIQEVKRRGIDVIGEHILQATEERIRMNSREERLAYHRQLEEWVTASHFLIAETSFPSVSVGYEISLALIRRKHVLVLYHEGGPPALLAHHESDRILCERYTIETLPSIISDFLLYLRAGSDTRFTFFISNRQAEHLAKAASRERIPKSVYLRRLIDDDMHRPDA